MAFHPGEMENSKGIIMITPGGQEERSGREEGLVKDNSVLIRQRMF